MKGRTTKVAKYQKEPEMEMHRSSGLNLLTLLEQSRVSDDSAAAVEVAERKIDRYWQKSCLTINVE